MSQSTISVDPDGSIWYDPNETATHAPFADEHGQTWAVPYNHYPTGSAPLTEWVGGQGNSGCRFVGSPTYIENTGVNGGQISYAASFKEVGDWQ